MSLLNKLVGTLFVLTGIAVWLLVGVAYVYSETDSAPILIYDTGLTLEERAVNEYFAYAPIMSKIAYCESRYRQFSDGEVLRGVVNSDDVGIFQINTYYHEETAKSMGLDIYTLDGNIKYAEVLYRKNGTRDWLASQSCWKGE